MQSSLSVFRPGKNPLLGMVFIYLYEKARQSGPKITMYP